MGDSALKKINRASQPTQAGCLFRAGHAGGSSVKPRCVSRRDDVVGKYDGITHSMPPPEKNKSGLTGDKGTAYQAGLTTGFQKDGKDPRLIFLSMDICRKLNMRLESRSPLWGPRDESIARRLIGISNSDRSAKRTPGRVVRKPAELASARRSYASTPGDIRAYVCADRERWPEFFTTVPRPGECGIRHLSSGSWETCSAKQCMGEISLEREIAALYFPLGSLPTICTVPDRTGKQTLR